MHPMQMLKNTIGALLATVALLFLLPLSSATQDGGNPFELSPRLSIPPSDGIADSATTADTGNPFDLVAPAEPAGRPKPAATPPPASRKTASAPASVQSRYRTFLLIANISILLLLTVLITLLRSQAGKAYRAFFNDNLLSQLQREREAGGGLPYYFFYGFFMINAGFFVFLLARHYGLSFSHNYWAGLLYCIGGAAGLFLAKHILLGFLAFVFPIDKEVHLYSFTIIVFSIMLGFFLVIVNLLLSYSPEESTQWVLYGAYACIGATYIFRSLRGLFIGNRFLLFHKFHFLLYICTVEIAPVLVLAKLVLNS